jgi:hypothetical protein
MNDYGINLGFSNSCTNDIAVQRTFAALNYFGRSQPLAPILFQRANFSPFDKCSIIRNLQLKLQPPPIGK